MKIIHDSSKKTLLESDGVKSRTKLSDGPELPYVRGLLIFINHSVKSELREIPVPREQNFSVLLDGVMTIDKNMLHFTKTGELILKALLQRDDKCLS